MSCSGIVCVRIFDCPIIAVGSSPRAKHAQAVHLRGTFIVQIVQHEVRMLSISTNFMIKVLLTVLLHFYRCVKSEM